MIEHHSRAGKAHHLTDFLPHLRFVAMHSAVRAECLRFHKRTMIASGLCIAFQFSTFAAESAFGVVLLSAVQRDHLRHHLLFLFPLSGCSIHIYNLSCFYPPGRATSVPARVTCSFCLEASMSAHSPVFCIAAAISSSARFPRCRHSLQSASWIPDGIPARPFYPSALLSVPLKSRPR